MKLLITGAEGMLGRTLVSQFSSAYEVVVGTHKECDITDFDVLCEKLELLRPDVVIHCAAMTDVDRCEIEADKAYLVNSLGTKNVARACHQNKVKLISISTDYVFDGKLDRPYCEIDFADGGTTIYGRSKWLAEEMVRTYCPNHIIARVSWLYGSGGPSFVHTMLRLADEGRPEIKVVDDQVGNPTSCTAVAYALKELIQRPEVLGTIHISCKGEATWYEFAKEIFKLTHKKQLVTPCSSIEYKTKAKRPYNSRLNKLRLQELGLLEMPNWKDALISFLKDEIP